jgi:hypothetical protein
MDSLAVKAYTCKCGHQAELHPFDEWSPQEEDGSCAMCDCRSFSPKHLFWWLFFAPVVKVILILLILIFFMVGMCVNVTPIFPPEM